MTRCKGCGAEIRWIKTAAGKNMPLDFQPVRFYVNMKNLVDDEDRWEVINGHQAHWATCPNATEFKRKKRAFKRVQIGPGVGDVRYEDL